MSPQYVKAYGKRKQERRGRCRSDLRGSAPTVDAVCTVKSAEQQAVRGGISWIGSNSFPPLV